MSRRPDPLAAVRQFQSEVDEIREGPEPIAAQMTVLVVVGLLLGAIAFISFTRVDRVVTSSAGKIVPTSLVNVFQALDPSIIRSLDVREGDHVKQGQVLATLDPTFTEADVQQLKLQVISLEAQIARANAELAGGRFLLPQNLASDKLHYVSLQKGLYEQRIAQYKAQLASFDAKIKQTQTTIKKLQGDQNRFQQRERIARDIEQMRTTLAATGTGSQLNKWISQDARIELIRTMEFNQNSLVEAEHTLESLQADRQAFVEQWSTSLSQELVKAQNDLDSAQANLDKALRHHDLVRLIAPEDSFILTMAKLSVGSILKQGDPLFTLMPAYAPVEAEIQISSRDVGFIRANDRCIIKVDAFQFTRHGTAEGKVRWISDGSFTADENGKPVDAYYKARCSIDAMNFKNVPAQFRLIPGMTLSADIKIGTRSVASYLLDGLTRGIYESMREP